MKNAKIFAIGTLMSSNLVYNLDENIHETDLKNMQLIADFTEQSMNDSNAVPFQSMLFLVQDFNKHGSELDFEDGRKYLYKNLIIKDSDSLQVNTVKKLIHSTFEHLSCFLLPKLSDSGTKTEIETVISSLLDPSNLKVKKINGHELTANEFVDLVDVYFEILKSPDMLNNKTIYEITVEQQMNILVADLFETYKKNIELFKDYSKQNFQEYLKKSHEFVKNFAMLKFQVAKKMGGKEVFRTSSNKLDAKIEEYFKQSMRETMRTYYEAHWKQLRTQREIEERTELQKVVTTTRTSLRESQNKVALLNSNLVKMELSLSAEKSKNNQMQLDFSKLESVNKKLQQELSEKAQESTSLTDQIIQLKNAKYLKDLETLQRLKELKAKETVSKEDIEKESAHNINLDEITTNLQSCLSNAEEARKTEKFCEVEKVQLKANLDGLFQQITKEKRNFDVIFEKIGDWSE